jgi:MFS family permease
VTTQTSVPKPRNYTPEMVILAGCLIAILTFGPRSAIGAFQKEMLLANHWTRDIFSFGIALQNLMWGIGQPFAGALADRFGAVRILWGGAILYGVGLALMAYAQTPLTFNMVGILTGFGLSGCSFNLVLGAFGKLIPEHRRSMAFGFGTAAGSFGQFLFSPLAVGMIGAVGWQSTTLIFAGMMTMILPLALVLATPHGDPLSNVSSLNAPPVNKQSFAQALAEAFCHRSYVLLVLGFFTCGFQLAFVTAHFQIYITDQGLSPQVGGWAFALIGIFNIAGSLYAGWLGPRVPRRWVLSFIYLARSLAVIAFLLIPTGTVSTLMFGAVLGLLWLSTVPPTSSLIGIMFGPRYFAMLYGFAFFSHQVGGFLGVLLGGVLYEATGSYAIVWYLSVALGIISAFINLPIRETPVVRAPVTV